MSEGAKTLHTAIAAARDDTDFKAVKLRKAGGRMEVLWTKRMPEEDGSWGEFTAQCGFTGDAGAQKKARDKHTASVVGLDSTAVAFYRLTTPAVAKEETEAIVRMQAESVLPLEPEQIAVAWRTMPSTNGEVNITLAAARRDHLFAFARSVRNFGSPDVYLSCEGAVKAWQRFFTEVESEAVLISVGRRDTQVCLIRAGLVAHTAVFPTGLQDLTAVDEQGTVSEPAELTERFTQDVRSAIESFHGDRSVGLPILILSDGSEEIDRIVASLHAGGLPAKPSLPKSQALELPADCEWQDLYKYRVPLGLALMALESPSQALNLFVDMNEQEQARKTRSAQRSVRLAAVLAAIMLVALVVAAYVVDVASEKRLSSLVNQPQFEKIREQEKLLKTVARHRPDPLALLKEINGGDAGGIVLDSFHFKKGQRVTLVGRADNEERMWAFQKHLRGQKGMEEVEISTAIPDSKTKKIKFTINFHYRQFTKKAAVL
ncbi:MAG: hypothetical protein JW741_04405 [Sedimentisphaerales bacterium]|nr:hypothetical protein [Sedimentisphaerales bacterium]